mgnify:CR=1 FL=1
MHPVVGKFLPAVTMKCLARQVQLLAVLLTFGFATGTGIHAQQESTEQDEQRSADLPLRRLSESPNESEWELTMPSAASEESQPLDEDVASRVEVSLQAAREAMRDGRIDQPASQSAWSYYREVLTLDPDNVEAQQVLVTVQQQMI